MLRTGCFYSIGSVIVSAGKVSTYGSPTTSPETPSTTTSALAAGGSLASYITTCHRGRERGPEKMTAAEACPIGNGALLDAIASAFSGWRLSGQAASQCQAARTNIRPAIAPPIIRSGVAKKTSGAAMT